MTERLTCAEVRDLLPELATGVAAGDERARVLSHLATCPACRQELDEMTTVVDELVLLTPEREPSPGFESAVLAAVAPPAQSRRTPLVLAAAATLIGALLAGGVVWWQTSDDRELAGQYRHTLAEADGRYLVSAALHSEDEPNAGHVFAYQGNPSWVFMTVSSIPWSGRYKVQLVTDDGRTRDLGWCQVTDGRGSWGRAVHIPVHDIRELRLVIPGSHTVRANFT
jgi:hypothetical protein